jgi:hypothetical protein
LKEQLRLVESSSGAGFFSRIFLVFIFGVSSANACAAQGWRIRLKFFRVSAFLPTKYFVRSLNIV